ncbi:MAG: acetolactate synthase large subunit [Acidimicrobiaceae bacterium]
MSTGAERLITAAVTSGVEVCFANPGTTELPLVAALDSVPGVRAVLGLFEGVCTGAADGYGRVAGRPALTLLHLGPGFANGIANLHNARRARTPVVNLIGDHATWHLAADAPLTSDITSLASPVSGWVRTAATADGLADDLVDAVAAARTPPGQVATLIVPVDCQWDSARDEPIAPRPAAKAAAVGAEAIANAAKAVVAGPSTVLYVGGAALRARGLRAVARVQAATGCRVFAETFAATAERGRHLPWVRSLPYFPERAVEALEGADVFVTAGAPPPVSFFAVRGVPSVLIPDGCTHLTLAEPGDDVEGALEALADALGATTDVDLDERADLEVPSGGRVTADSAGQAVAALLPEGAIVIDEAATSGLGFTLLAPAAAPHTTLALTGGAIGSGLPLAVGAAVAAPDRRVVALQADGSGMYTLQSLWTMARESLDVTVVVFSNRRYAILGVELHRAGIDPGAIASALTDLSHPDLDWVSLATGMGVPASRATTNDEMVEQLRRSLQTPGPSLIEAAI